MAGAGAAAGAPGGGGAAGSGGAPWDTLTVRHCARHCVVPACVCMRREACLRAWVMCMRAPQVNTPRGQKVKDVSYRNNKVRAVPDQSD